MKKILSMTLVIGILIGILGVAPVSALTKDDYNLPYYFCDHENSIYQNGIEFTNHANSELVEGGVNGSGYCAKITDPATQIGEGVAFDDCAVATPEPANISYAVNAGDTFRLSFWVKFGQQMTKNRASFTLISALSTGGYILDPATNTHPIVHGDETSTDWQKITFEWTAPQACTIKYVILRIANGGNLNWVAGGNKDNPGDRVYYIDDVEAAVYPAGTFMTDNVSADATDYRMTFENGSSLYTVNNAAGAYKFPTTTEVVGSFENMQLISDPEDGDNQVLKVTAFDTTGGSSNSIFVGSKIAASSRFSVTVPAGATLTYKFRYYLVTEMKNNGAGFFMYHDGGKHCYSTGSFNTEQGVWHDAVISYTNTSNATETMGKAVLWWTYNGGTAKSWIAANAADGHYGERTILFDDFCSYITEAGETKGAVAPTSSALTGTGAVTEGQKVTFTNTFVPAANGSTTDKSFVRFVSTDANGRKTSLGMYRINDEITVPALPANGTVSIEVIPVDSNGLVGKTVSYPVSIVTTPEVPITLTLTDDRNTASAEVSFGSTYAGAENVSLYIVFYNTNREMVKCNVFSGTSAAAIPGEMTYTSEDGVKYIKAFVWSNDGNFIPLVDCEVIEK